MKLKFRMYIFITATVLIGLSPLIYYLGYIYDGDWDSVLGAWEAVRKTILIYHQFPFWNPWHAGGTPLFANPCMGLFSIELIFVLLFGTVQGLELALIILLIIGAIGMYQMLGDYIETKIVKYWGAVLFALQGTIAIHLSVGHDVMIVIIWLPWLIFLVKRIKYSLSSALFFALILAIIINNFIHYVSILVFITISFFILHQWIHNYKNTVFYKNIILSGLLFLSLSFYKVLIAFYYFNQYPREMTERVSIPLITFIRALIVPGQYCKSFPVFLIKSNTNVCSNYCWYWHEFGSYIGIIATFLFLFWLIKDYLLPILKYLFTEIKSFSLKALLQLIFCKWWFWGALLTLSFALNSESHYLPGYWIREFPVFKSMFAITRWRFLTLFFIITGTCFCMNSFFYPKKKSQDKVIKCILAALIFISITGLIYNQFYCWEKTNKITMESYLKKVPDTSKTIRSSYFASGDFPATYKGIGRINSYEVMLGYIQDYRSARIPFEDKKNYKGEIYSLDNIPIKVLWSPNRIEISTPKANRVLINQNPGNNWFLNGYQLFPQLKSFDKQKLFILNLPKAGVYILEAKSPVYEIAKNLSLGFMALFIVFLYLFYIKKHPFKK